MADLLNILAPAGTIMTGGVPVARGTFTITPTDAYDQPIPVRAGSSGPQFLAGPSVPVAIVAGGLSSSLQFPNPALSSPQNVKARIEIVDLTLPSKSAPTRYPLIDVVDDGSGNWSFSDFNTGLVTGSIPVTIVGGNGGGGSSTPKFTGSKLAMFTDSYGQAYGSFWIPQVLLKTGFGSGYMDLQSGRQTANIFSHLAGSTDSQIVASLQTALTGSDAILIELGTNDSGFSANIGSPSDYGNGSYYGYLNRAIQLIQRARPDLMILWVGAIQGSYNTLANLQSVNNAIKTACANNGVPFLNMLENSGINSFNLSTFSLDGIHLTSDAYTNRWAPLIVDFILNNCAVGTSGSTETGDAVPFLAFPSITSHVTTDSPFSITAATSNSSGAITYSVSGPATMSGVTVTLSGTAGTVYVTASQAAVAGFTAASITQPFAVNAPIASSDTSFIAAHITDSALVVTADGTLLTISGFYASNFISVTPGTSYTMAKGDPAAANPAYGAAYYNSSKAYLSGVAGPFTDGQTFVAPAGVSYIRFSGDDTFIGSQSFAPTSSTVAPTITFTAIPDKLTSASAFSISVSSNSSGTITYGITGPATISGTTITLTGSPGTVTVTASQAAAAGYTTGSASRSFNVTFPTDSSFVSGHITANSLIKQADGTMDTSGGLSAYYASNYISVTPATVIHIAKGCDAANPVYGASWYNSSKVFLSSAGSDPTSDGQAFTPPTGAAYIRFSGNQSTIGSQAVT